MALEEIWFYRSWFASQSAISFYILQGCKDFCRKSKAGNWTCWKPLLPETNHFSTCFFLWTSVMSSTQLFSLLFIQKTSASRQAAPETQGEKIGHKRLGEISRSVWRKWWWKCRVHPWSSGFRNARKWWKKSTDLFCYEALENGERTMKHIKSSGYLWTRKLKAAKDVSFENASLVNTRKEWPLHVAMNLYRHV